MTSNKPTLAVIGGTGKEGGGLALRWANEGYPVIIGSRSLEKAETKADELNQLLPDHHKVRGMANPDAAEQAKILILTVPYSAHKPTLEGIRSSAKGKVLVDVTVPLSPPKVHIVSVPEGRSAAEEAQALLGDEVTVVSAFQNVSAHHLKDLEHSIDCDVLVCGDDAEAKAQVIELVEATGMRGIDAGVLANAVVSEGLTSVLIAINKRYKIKDAGIRISGIN